MNSRKRCAPQQQQKRKRGIQIQYPANRAYGMNGNYYHFGKKILQKIHKVRVQLVERTKSKFGTEESCTRRTSLYNLVFGILLCEA